MSTKKIYRVSGEAQESTRFVRAKTRNQAIAWAAQVQFSAHIATPDELLQAGRDGVTIVDLSDVK